MSGFVYLIRNKDLYKIGITQNLEQRMKALKPDEILSTMKTENYEALEKQLHKKYSAVRIPQTEYFRLSFSQATECKELLESDPEKLNSNISEISSSGFTTKSAFIFAPAMIALAILSLGGLFDLFIDDSWTEIYAPLARIITPFIFVVSLLSAIIEFFLPPEDKNGPVSISFCLWSLIIFIFCSFFTGSTA